jgi:hypothetical protein
MDADLLYALLLKCWDSVPVVNAIGTKRIPIDQQQIDAIYDCRIKHLSKRNLVSALKALNRYWKPSHAVQYRLLSLGMNEPTLIELMDVFNYGSAADLELLHAVVVGTLQSKLFVCEAAALKVLNSGVKWDADMVHALLMQCCHDIRVIEAAGAKRVALEQHRIDAIYDCLVNQMLKRNLITAFNALYEIWQPSQSILDRLLRTHRLDFYPLCEIASFLTLIDFKNFVSICQAWSACRHDLQTVMRVLRNSYQSHDLVFIRQTVGPKIYARYLNGQISQQSYENELAQLIWSKDQPRLRALLPLVEVSKWETIIASYQAPQLMVLLKAALSVDFKDYTVVHLILKRIVGMRTYHLDLVNAFVQCRFVPSVDLATNMAKDALRNFDPDQCSKLISLRPDMCDIILSLALSTGNVVGLSSLSRPDQRPSQDAIDAAVESLAHEGRCRILKSMMHLHLRPSHSAVARIMAIPNLSPAISRLFTN